MIAQIIEPISYEQVGNEVDSTDDLIDLIKKLNERIENKNLSTPKSDNPTNDIDERIVVEDVFVDNDVEKGDIEPQGYSKGDIRNFGRVGYKTDDASKEQNKLRLRKSINDLRDKRLKGSVLPDVAVRMKATRMIDKLFDNEMIESPKGVSVNVKKQKDSGISIVGSDVKSLFPSLKAIETARLARWAILNSDVTFENWNTKKAMRFLYITGGQELINQCGLERFSPRWLGDRGDLLTVGGDKSKDESMWRDSSREVFTSDMKKIAAAVLEVAIHIAMSTHVYQFCGRFFLQKDGGPIGLRSTAALASLIMKIWDISWLQLLKKEMVEVLLYCRYVDDYRSFLRPLLEG